MSSDEGWEEVFENDISLKIDSKEVKTRREIMFDIAKWMMKIYLDIFEDFDVPEVSETIDYNIKRQLTNKFVDKDDPNNYNNNLKLFKSFKYYGIFSRIYFVFNKNTTSFIETCVNNKIIENKEKWNGCVFYIDTNFEIEDYSWHFSRNIKHHSIFLYVLDKLKNTDLKVKESPFFELDRNRLKILPSSLSKFLKHPLYVLQSQLRYNLSICPKRPVCGYFKGEPVFLRKNIIKLKTQSQFYKLGKEIVSEKPFKTHGDIKLYSEYQTKDIVIEDMREGYTQDYFHENHVPRNCIFIENEYSEQVCKILNLEHRRCFRGFKRSLPFHSGVFIYKKDAFLFSNFLFEYSENIRRAHENERKLEALNNWRKIFKTVTKFLEIRKKLGLTE
ncbi:DNA repair protein complementing XP-C cells like protein [Nosema granulosis]|uniref:DNA repair protein complementing XP-C cells like protein n=1 Tax=Nosema granulosis TaxID=83296 RepID=A0A9P6H006_9MICR|nr:DNA repair protein complementing XP-C cells like protein [Nosema granulosis]